MRATNPANKIRLLRKVVSVLSFHVLVSVILDPGTDAVYSLYVRDRKRVDTKKRGEESGKNDPVVHS